MGTAHIHPSETLDITRPAEKLLLYDTKYLNCEVSACVFRCGPLLSAGTASASSRNPLCGVFRHVLFPQESTVLRSKHHRNSESEIYRTVAKHHVSEGNTRRLLRESEDDETPQRASFASEEAHREPAESVVYFRSGMLRRSL